MRRPDVCLAPPAAAAVDEPEPSTGQKLAGYLAWLLNASKHLVKKMAWWQ